MIDDVFWQFIGQQRWTLVEPNVEYYINDPHSMGNKTDATHLSSTYQVPYDVSKCYEQWQQTNCVLQVKRHIFQLIIQHGIKNFQGLEKNDCY